MAAGHTMPKRKVRSAAQIASQRKASLAAARQRVTGRVISFAAPPAKAKAAQQAYTPPGTGGRRHKLGGKAYQKKSGSGVTLAPWAATALAGGPVKPSKEFAPSAIRGDVVQERGTPFRKRRKKPKAK